MTGSADVCLLDFQLGDRSGLELLSTLEQRGVRTPVVMLTATTDHQVDIEAMKAGAVDYLVKGEFTGAVLELEALTQAEGLPAPGLLAIETAREALRRSVGDLRNAIGFSSGFP